MNRNDDIERVLEHWLADGPVHMSDRLFNGTLERIDALPKRRLADLRLRLPILHLNLSAVVIAAVLIAVGAMGAAVLLRIPSVGPAPTPSPARPATMVPASVMGSLTARWDSVGPRPIPGSQYESPIDMEMTPGLVEMNGFKGWVASTIAAQNDGTLLYTLTEPQASLTSQHWTCMTGDRGHYRVQLSADRVTLTLTVHDDACSTRATVLSGDWTRSPCEVNAQGCMTQLSPGRHDATGFRPFRATGSMSYAVPGGWAVPYLAPTWPDESASSIFNLDRSSGGSSPISIWSDVAPAAVRPIAGSSPPSCEDAAAGIGRTPQAIATWLGTVPGVVASASQPIAIGGLGGVMVDVSMVPGWTMRCGSYSTQGDPPSPPVYEDEPVEIFQSSRTDYRVTLDPNVQVRAIILDAGDGTILLVMISDSSSEWDATLADAMPIVNSLEFSR